MNNNQSYNTPDPSSQPTNFDNQANPYAEQAVQQIQQPQQVQQSPYPQQYTPQPAPQQFYQPPQQTYGSNQPYPPYSQPRGYYPVQQPPQPYAQFQQQYSAYPPKKKTDPLAVISFCLGIITSCLFVIATILLFVISDSYSAGENLLLPMILTGSPGTGLGIAGIVRTSRARSLRKGKGFAVAGLVMSGGSLVMFCTFLLFGLFLLAFAFSSLMVSLNNLY